MAWVPGAITVVAIASVIVVTLWQLHPSLLLANTTTTGGDTGSHLALPKFLQTLLGHGQLTGWDPGWYDGFPLYTFYFTLPDLFGAVLGWIIPFNVAFKFITIMGSLLLPVCAWACGRLFRMRQPVPAVLAMFTLPYLFDYTFTIYGGNLFSTLAGEYAYSLSLALALLFLGLFARAVREGKYRIWGAVVLALCILSHIVPAMYALVGALVLTGIELLPSRWGIGEAHLVPLWRVESTVSEVPAVARRTIIWWAVSTVGLGLLLSGWWLAPFGLDQAYATSMNYSNLSNFSTLLFPGADAWALVMAGLAVILTILVRSRFGVMVTLTGIASALGLIFDPQGSLYNVRLLPLWILSFYLMAGWGLGTGSYVVARWWRDRRLKHWEAVNRETWFAVIPPQPDREDSPEIVRSPATIPALHRAPSPRWGPAAVSGGLLGILFSLIVVVPPFVSWAAADLPVTLGPNEVTNWSSYNYMGYQRQSSWNEYHSIIDTMQNVAKRYGCGRAMWEYSSSENRFGTPEALMLLPFWTNNCVDSMEGLLFESSATTPYHFIDQAELSAGPSDPEVGLPYGPLDVSLGVQHLQLLGVKYFMAETTAVEAEANADPALKLVATSGPWTYNYNGVNTTTTWDIYVVRDASLVEPLRNDPDVVEGIHAKPSSWLNPSLSWYDDPSRWYVELAQSGPLSWPRVTLGSGDVAPPVRAVPSTTVSHVQMGLSSISFHVSRVGSPVLVKISYFPNWHASGASGPWRVTPNLMVVIPTSHHVTLTYGRSPSNVVGDGATLGGLVVIAGAVAGGVRKRRLNRTDRE
jgi:hypothetical protein